MANTGIVAWLGVLLGGASLGWHVMKHIGDHRVRLFWTITSGMSVKSPNGFVRVTLINRGRRTAILDKVSVEFRGPSLAEMSDEDFQRLAERQKKEFKALGFPGLGPLRYEPAITSHVIQIASGDAYAVEIPTDFSVLKKWPGYRSGVSIALRDGRCRFLSWDVIHTPRKRRHRYHLPRLWSWLVRDV